VVAKTLVETSHQSQLNGHLYGYRGGDELRDEAHVQVIHLVVEGLQPLGRAG